MVPADHLVRVDLVYPLRVGGDEDVGLLVGSDPGFGGLDGQVDDVADHEDPLTSLLVVGALKQSHDLFGDAEMSVAEHLGSSSHMQVDLIEVLDLLPALETDAIRLSLTDSLLHKLLLHLADSFLV